MRYIRIDPKSLEADVVASKDDKAICVPLRRERSGSPFTDLLHYTVRFDVLYPMDEASDRKRVVRVKYSLHEADPWRRTRRYHVGGIGAGTYLGRYQTFVLVSIK